jgi:uncharacterized membrane protein YfcA
VQYVVLFFVGVVAGTAGGLLGIGGSIIMIPALTLLPVFELTGPGADGRPVGVPVPYFLAAAAAMWCNSGISAAAAYRHWRNGAVVGRVVRFLMITAVPFILGGVFLSVLLQPPAEALDHLEALHEQTRKGAGELTIRLLYGVFTTYAMVSSIRKAFALRRRAAAEMLTAEQAAALPAWRAVFVGVPMGTVAGLLGVGGGPIAVPGQQLALKLPAKNAIANSSMTIVVSALLGAAYKLMSLPAVGGDPHLLRVAALRYAACLLPGALLGGYLGAWLHKVIRTFWIHICFAAVMAVVAYRMVSPAVASWWR